MDIARAHEVLLPRWTATCRSAGVPTGTPEAAATDAAGLDLIARWGQPHRRYHDLDHLLDVLDGLAALADPDVRDGLPDPVAELAAWFHDAVYDGRPGQDEEASAVLAEQVLAALGASADVVAEVARLVRLTTTHDPADGDEAGALLVDADLAVLAREPTAYRRYTDAIRAEYAHVPDEFFRPGRAAVLESLLAKPFLFRTARGRGLWEDAARANVRAEIARLTSGL